MGKKGNIHRSLHTWNCRRDIAGYVLYALCGLAGHFAVVHRILLTAHIFRGTEGNSESYGHTRGDTSDYAAVVIGPCDNVTVIVKGDKDRETGKTGYKIVKEYRSGVSAVFWQGVARLFGQNLKSKYDPTGEDLVTEELVRKWESGEFRDLYYSIFFEYPKQTVIPEKYR